jgi:ferritin-like metal-binding protein YciE
MKLFSANLKDLRELYLNSLQKALDMEQQITKALPTMIEKATDPQLRHGFQTHLRETKLHAQKVENILVRATGKASTITCKVAHALITEAQDSIKDAADPAVMDVALIAAAQRVEHHEISVYGTLRAWATLLGEMQAAATLETILHEEKNADHLLSTVADSVNLEAEQPVYSSKGNVYTATH